MKNKWRRTILNKRGEEDYGEVISGIVMTVIVVAFCGFAFGWGRTILWVAIVIGGLSLIIAGISLLRDYIAGMPDRKRERDARMEKLQEEIKARKENEAREAEVERQREERERILKERESYDEYKAAVGNSKAGGKLAEATKIIDGLQNDNDAERRPEIQKFFDKYLPVMTASLNASTMDSVDIDKTIDTFTQAVKAFSSELYNADDVVERNKALLESLAIRDGLYDPYDNKLSPEETEDSQQ